MNLDGHCRYEVPESVSLNKPLVADAPRIISRLRLATSEPCDALGRLLYSTDLFVGIGTSDGAPVVADQSRHP